MKKVLTVFGQEVKDYPLNPVTNIPLKSKDPFNLEFPYPEQNPGTRQPGIIDIIRKAEKNPSVIKVKKSIKWIFK
jgi:hypothetical protein